MAMKTDTRQLHYREEGSGPPILFVHGWPTNANIWKYQFVDVLTDEYQVIAVDLPGFGETPPYGEASMKGFATTVKDFIEAHALSPVFLVGWSMGAGVVMSYNEHFGGHRLSGLGIVDDCPKLFPSDDWRADVDTTFDRETVDRWRHTWDGGDRRSVITEVTNLEFKSPERHSADISWAIDESLKSHPEFAMAALLEVMELDFRDSLTTTTVPTLLLYGAHSNMTTAANRRFMKAVIPNSELVVFEDSGHNPMIEEADKFNDAVASFARKL